MELGGNNDPAQVKLVQRALNLVLRKAPPLRPDGEFGDLTKAAVIDFQGMLRLVPNGVLGADQMAELFSLAKGMGWSEEPQADDRPIWLDVARGEAGQHEYPGLPANPRILEYIATFPYLKQIRSPQGVTMNQTDETAWCACFVNWCLLRAGQSGGPDASAASWRNYGQKLGKPKEGAIAVIFKQPTAGLTASGFHVSFWVGGTATKPHLWGGNQGNTVKETDFSGWQVMAYRWPA